VIILRVLVIPEFRHSASQASENISKPNIQHYGAFQGWSHRYALHQIKAMESVDSAVSVSCANTLFMIDIYPKS